MNTRMLDVLACPVCKGSVQYDAPTQALLCHADSLSFPIRNGIPVMLPEEASWFDAKAVPNAFASDQ